MESNELVIRFAQEGDIGAILTLIRELAEYEKLTHEVVATEDSIRQALFGVSPAAGALVAEREGETAGYAVFFTTFSTFLGRPGLYLEDIYVRPHFRRSGIGRALFARVAGIARDRGCGRLEWSVLKWNTPAVEFYRGLGAVELDEWTTFRLTGKALDEAAQAAGD